MATLDYSLYAKWTSTGYSTFNEADRMTRFTIDRGREEMFGDSINPYDIGELRIELDNFDGRYDWWASTSPLYGLIKPGVDMQMQVTYDSTTVYLFTGQLEEFEPSGYYRDKVVLTVQDGWKHLQENDYQLGTNEDGASSTACLPQDSYYNIFTTMLTSTDFAPYPWGSDIPVGSTGAWNIPIYYWYDKGSMKEFVEMVDQGAIGRSAVLANGSFWWRDVLSGSTNIVAVSEDECLKNPYMPVNWDSYKSKVVIDWPDNYFITTTDVRLAQSTGTAIFYDASGSTSYSGTMEWLVKNVDMAPTTDNCYWYWADGYSPSMSSTTYWDFSITGYGTTGIDFTIVKNGWAVGSTSRTFVGIVYCDYGTHPTSDWKFESTNTEMPDAEMTLDSQWLNLNETNVNNMRRVAGVALTYLNYMGSIRKYPAIQMRGRYLKQFEIDLDYQVNLTAPTINATGFYWIRKISHETLTSPQDVLTTFHLMERLDATTDYTPAPGVPST